MRQAPQGKTAQAMACLIVATVHIGLFWLLSIKPRHEETASGEASRLRVIFLPRTPPAAPAPPPLPARMPTPQASDRMPVRSTTATVLDSAPTPAAAIETTDASAAEIGSQAAAWAAQSVPGNSFDPDPLRSRRAQLPGGERAGQFAMRPPPSPQRTLRMIGQFLAGPDYTTDPCPEIREKLAGLMTDSSEAGRRALEQELDLDRRYCRR